MYLKHLQEFHETEEGPTVAYILNLSKFVKTCLGTILYIDRADPKLTVLLTEQ